MADKTIEQAIIYPVLLNGDTTLNVRAVTKYALWQFVKQLGGVDFINDPTTLSRLPDEARQTAMDTIDRMWTYCIGWGVIDDPPEDALAELEAMGLISPSPRLTRANWVRWLLLDDQSDAWNIFWTVWMATMLDERETDNGN